MIISFFIPSLDHTNEQKEIQSDEWSQMPWLKKLQSSQQAKALLSKVLVASKVYDNKDYQTTWDLYRALLAASDKLEEFIEGL